MKSKHFWPVVASIALLAGCQNHGTPESVAPVAKAPEPTVVPDIKGLTLGSSSSVLKGKFSSAQCFAGKDQPEIATEACMVNGFPYGGGESGILSVNYIDDKAVLIRVVKLNGADLGVVKLKAADMGEITAALGRKLGEQLPDQQRSALRIGMSDSAWAGKDWLFVVSPNDNGSVTLASIEYLTRLFHRQAAKVDSDL